MSCNRKIRRKPDLICASDLKNKVKLITRKIETANVSFTENFTDFKSIYARIDTISGYQPFNGVNIEDAPSHIFYIRYLSDIEINYTFEYKSNYFHIIDIENLNEENRFMKITVKKAGNKSNEANWA